MSEPEQERQGGAPADTPEIRRLRVVSAFTDPFLVTKLPQETSVVSSVIRLGERTVLGFLHQPFPDGTRVRVVYREWLLAERIEESGSGPPDAARAAEEAKPAEEAKSAEEAKPTDVEPVGKPAEAEPADAEPDPAGPDAVGPEGEPDVAEPKGMPAEAEPEEPRAVEGAEDDASSHSHGAPAERKQAQHDPPAERKQAQRPDRGKASGSDEAEGRNVFPEDLTGTDEEDAHRGKEDDPWTDAFRRGRKRRSGED